MEQKLSDVSSRYGAPMGRRGYFGDREAAIELGVYPVRLDDGGYDNGGAYWGSGEPLWRVLGDDEQVEFYIRAKSRADAIKAVLDDYPNATISTTADAEAGLQEFTIAYTAGLLWATSDSGPEMAEDAAEYPRFDDFDHSQIDAELQALIDADCKAFYDANRALWADKISDTQAGHRFALTRQETGCGFSDESFEASDVLDEKAGKYRQLDLRSYFPEGAEESDPWARRIGRC